MKKVIVLLASIIPFQLLVSKNRQSDTNKGLILNESPICLHKSLTHYSHGSAAHYSAVRYTKAIKKNDIKEVVLNADSISKIKEIIEQHFKGDNYVKCQCSTIKIIDTELLAIDETEVRKRCYSVKFLIEFYDKNDIHTHCYRHYYLAKDGSLYYMSEPFFRTGNIKDSNWIQQILDVIK
ncbi:hypothetical protein [Bacteroides heparinolyticus]|uniref:hypothetical protein n=1 Tax=Prevotella heparinolytica TaxID=28113 RepID=UPI0035A14AD2